MENRRNPRVNRPDQRKNYTAKPQFSPGQSRLGPDEMVFGMQSVLETLRSDQQIVKLYMEKGLSNPDIQNLAFQNRVTLVPSVSRSLVFRQTVEVGF